MNHHNHKCFTLFILYKCFDPSWSRERKRERRNDLLSEHQNWGAWFDGGGRVWVFWGQTVLLPWSPSSCSIFVADTLDLSGWGGGGRMILALLFSAFMLNLSIFTVFEPSSRWVLTSLFHPYSIPQKGANWRINLNSNRHSNYSLIFGDNDVNNRVHNLRGRRKGFSDRKTTIKYSIHN